MSPFLLRLEDFPNGGIETAMAFKGLPIGVSDGLAKNRRFWRGLFPGPGVRGDGLSPGGDRGALAHVARNRVVAAYARSDLFERRRVLMDDWVRYLALPGPRGGESRVLGVSWSKEAEGIGCSHQVQQGGLARGRPR